ncbi:MAG: GNAT family N-acetyltransferase [bacterium]
MSGMMAACRPVCPSLPVSRTPLIRIARMPTSVRDGNLMLRALTILDCPFLQAMFRNDQAVKSGRMRRRTSGSWISFWWRVRKTFPVAYCIECDAKRIGFIGLYDLALRERGRMSLVISDGNLRRKGYGSRAAGILMGALKNQRFVRTIIVEVEADNHGSLSFWRKIGFGEEQHLPGKIVMYLDLLVSGGP